MKTLAYMESRKLERVLATQHAIVAQTNAMAQYLLSFHPELLHGQALPTRIYLVVGSERGFCGDYNSTLLRYLDGLTTPATVSAPSLIIIGHKLATRLEGDARVLASIDGANVVEEIGAVLHQVVAILLEQQTRNRVMSLSVLYHDVQSGTILEKGLLPPFQDLSPPTLHYPHAPILNLSLEQFFAEFLEQALFFLLNEVLSTALMAESQQRIQHLEGALQDIDKKLQHLNQLSNRMRQEEITEEIEVILLSSGYTDV